MSGVTVNCVCGASTAVGCAYPALGAADRPDDCLATVSLADLLREVERFVRRFVVVSDHQAAVITVWIMHTHAIDAFDFTPYLSVQSPTKRSGKSRLLEALALLAQRPLRAAGTTTAALFRSITADTPPTLLLDEVDAVFGPKAREHEDLRALLNAGFERGTPVLRVVGEGSKMKVAEFHVYCPKALAGIGALPDTIADRSLVIALKRRARSETVETFRRREAQAAAAPLREQIVAWAREHADELAVARPQMPDELDDRAQDACEPLVAIADAAGGEWPERIRRAVVALRTEQAGAEDDTAGVRLLTDIHAVWSDGVEVLPTAELLEALFRLDASPWAEWWGQTVKSETVAPSRGAAMKLARMLKPFGIRPHDVGDRGCRRKGYRRSDFEDAFDRYLASEVAHVAHAQHASQESDFPRSRTEDECANLESAAFGMDAGGARRARPKTRNTPEDHDRHDFDPVQAELDYFRSVLGDRALLDGHRTSRPLPGDDGYLDLVFAAFEREHVTEGEWHVADRAHRSVASRRSP